MATIFIMGLIMCKNIESLSHTPETNRILYDNYTFKKLYSLKKKPLKCYNLKLQTRNHFDPVKKLTRV